MQCIVAAYIGMTYIVMACILMAYIVMVYTVMCVVIGACRACSECGALECRVWHASIRSVRAVRAVRVMRVRRSRVCSAMQCSAVPCTERDACVLALTFRRSLCGAGHGHY